MKKFKQFTAITRECVRFFKKYWFYKNNQEKYLSMKNISVKEIDKIRNELTIDFNIKDFSDMLYEARLDKDNYMLINALMVNSFYNNHELFKLLIKDTDKGDELYFNFIEKIFNNTHNQNVVKFNKIELNKSIQYINQEKFNILVLSKALNEANIELLEIIKPYITWDKNNTQIKECVMLAIIENGKKIKNTTVENEINNFMNMEDFLNSWDRSLPFKNRLQKNIHAFYGINIIEKLKQSGLINFSQLSHKKSQELLETLEDTKKYINQYIEYIHADYDKISIEKKFEFLKSKKVLNEEFWDNIIEAKNKKGLSKLFIHHEKIKRFMPPNKYQLMIEAYKEHILTTKNPLEDCTVQFVQLYPYVLNQDTISKVMNVAHIKTYTSPFELEARNLINEKYSEEIELQEIYYYERDNYIKDGLNQQKMLLNLLYEKNASVMNNEMFFKSVTESLRNDDLLEIYIRKYFKDNPNEELKKDIVHRLNIFNNTNQSPKVLAWVLENNLIEKIIPRNTSMAKEFLFSKSYGNLWAPLLIEKYNVSPDAIISQTVASFISNNELFKFILKNYQLTIRTQQELCNSVFAINDVDLATEMFKKGISPNDYYTEKFTNSPTQAGNILLKARLKEKLERKEHKPTVKKISKI